MCSLYHAGCLRSGLHSILCPWDAQAAEWYANLDALIHLLNANGSVNVFYSTPEQYTAAKHAEGLKLPLKTDDFFPYADQVCCLRTGCRRTERH